MKRFSLPLFLCLTMIVGCESEQKTYPTGIAKYDSILEVHALDELGCNLVLPNGDAYFFIDWKLPMKVEAWGGDTTHKTPDCDYKRYLALKKYLDSANADTTHRAVSNRIMHYTQDARKLTDEELKHYNHEK